MLQFSLFFKFFGRSVLFKISFLKPLTSITVALSKNRRIISATSAFFNRKRSAVPKVLSIRSYHLEIMLRFSNLNGILKALKMSALKDRRRFKMVFKSGGKEINLYVQYKKSFPG